MESSSRGVGSNQQDIGVDGVSARRRRNDDGPVQDPPASTLMIRVDGFDSLGSARRRKKALEQVSWVITDTVRSTDAVYRHGESGFCVVLAETPESEASGAASRVRRNVESMPLLSDAGVTVTVGVAAGTEAELTESIARAERAIAATPEANRVVLAR